MIGLKISLGHLDPSLLLVPPVAWEVVRGCATRFGTLIQEAGQPVEERGGEPSA